MTFDTSITSHTQSHTTPSGTHTTRYLAAGREDGPLLIFVHGWPELSLSWRHQLPVFAGLGFRAIAPDMRGYGGSTVYPELSDYSQRDVVADMVALLDGLGAEQAVWVGHDWGSPTVWALASHHPERCAAVASLCVPYRTIELGLEHIVSLVDRTVYPTDEYPLGQWDYMAHYEEDFDRATEVMDANPYNVAKALFRKGNPRGQGKPTGTAVVRRNGGWFGGADAAPDLPADHDVVTAGDLAIYAESLSRNGFRGPNAYYRNHAANAEYTAESRNQGRLDLPVLFVAATYDYTCETVRSSLAQPMRQFCTDLTEHVIDSGHWMAQERPAQLNATLASWLARNVGPQWPGAPVRPV
ncbi:MAG: alpha/beta fold hydrolase [Acidimicrobiales bacterium]